MKKLLLLLAIMLPMVVSAQKIAYDQTRDGGRFVSTDEVRATGITEKVKQWYCVTAFELNGEITYSIGVKTNWNVPFCIEKGMKLLFRNMNDEVIALDAESTLEVTVGEYFPGGTLKVFSGTAFYRVTTEDIQKIAAGIKKVRIETTSDPVDKEFSSDRIGKFIAKGYQKVVGTIRAKKADVSEGF